MTGTSIGVQPVVDEYQFGIGLRFVAEPILRERARSLERDLWAAPLIDPVTGPRISVKFEYLVFISLCLIEQRRRGRALDGGSILLYSPLGLVDPLGGFNLVSGRPVFEIGKTLIRVRGVRLLSRELSHPPLEGFNALLVFPLQFRDLSPKVIDFGPMKAHCEDAQK